MLSLSLPRPPFWLVTSQERNYELNRQLLEVPECPFHRGANRPGTARTRVPHLPVCIRFDGLANSRNRDGDRSGGWVPYIKVV